MQIDLIFYKLYATPLKKSRQSKKQDNNFIDKKKKERHVLGLVYLEEDFEKVTPNEEPDFKIKHKFNNLEFGVEVTEFYLSQSRARINNIPGYVSAIINQRQYKHKDDIHSLDVKEFTLIPGDGRKTQQKIKGILQEQPKVEEYVENVAKLIDRKNKHFDSYLDGLNHVNLIVYDREHRLAGTPSDKFHNFFFKPKLEKVLLESKFREIFFVTEIGTFPSPKKVYIPLKMLFLVAEIYRLNHIAATHYPIEVKKLEKKEAQLIVEYLKWRGAKGVAYKIEPNGYEIAYGNSSVFIGKDNKVNIKDHNDYDLSNRYRISNNKTLYEFYDTKFKKHFDKSLVTHIFTTELHFPQKGEC